MVQVQNAGSVPARKPIWFPYQLSAAHIKMAFYRIGVDVGGTNTDAAILNAAPAALPEQDLHRDQRRGVCASSKTPTTADVTSGICTAIVDVLAKAQIPAQEVRSVAIGTTHFVNAVVEADPRRLSRVAVIRLCGPYTRAVFPYP